MDYSIKYTDSSIIISNTGIVDITYVLGLLVCGVNTKRAEGIIKPNSQLELKLLTSDGKYNLKLNTSTEEVNETFDFYSNTIGMIVNSIENICSTEECLCKDDKNSCDNLVTSLVMSLSYYFIEPNRYQKSLDYLSNTLSCNIQQLLSCIINTNYITGKSDFKNLSEQFSVIFYSLFYVDGILSSATEEEVNKIKSTFKYDKLSKCVKKYGIDIDDMIDNTIDTESIRVYYYQSLNLQETIMNLSNTLTPELLALKPNSPLSRFQQGATVPLEIVGKQVFVIRETANLTYTIEDSLGNDITSSFDSTYNNTLSARIFLSKLPYTISNIYFKFKQSING